MKFINKTSVCYFITMQILQFYVYVIIKKTFAVSRSDKIQLVVFCKIAHISL